MNCGILRFSTKDSKRISCSDIRLYKTPSNWPNTKTQKCTISSNSLLEEGLHHLESHLLREIGEGKEPHDCLLLIGNSPSSFIFLDVIFVLPSSIVDLSLALAFISFYLHLVLNVYPVFVDALKDAGKHLSRQLLAPGGNKSSQLPRGRAMLAQESGNYLLCHL